MRKARLVGGLGIRILPLFTSGGLGDEDMIDNWQYSTNYYNAPFMESFEQERISSLNNILDKYNLDLPQQTRYEPITTSYPRE